MTEYRCKKCGSVNIELECDTNGYYVKCENCGHYVGGKNTKEALKNWEREAENKMEQATPQVCGQKKKLVLEFKENNGKMEVDVKIGKLTTQDICYAQGALLKKISEEYYGNDLHKLLFKLRAVHDICITLDLAPVAKSIENAIKQYGLKLK